MPVIRVLVMLATMMMKLVKTTKEKKVFKNVGVSIMGITFWEAIKDSIKKQIKKSDWICGNVKTADDYLKTHPNSWLNSTIGVVTITTMLMNVCFADDQSKKEVAQAQKEAENARDRANKSGIELEQEKQKTEQEKQKTEQEKQKTIKEQKDFIKYVEQNCQENHGQFLIEKGGTKAGIGGITIEAEAKCKTPKPAKTNQTPIQPKHLPNSKQPHSQRGSKAQELIAYLQKELESLPYSQKAIVKQVDFYRPSSIAYLELDPRDFKVTEEWQNENLKIRSKAQAKMLEMRKPQANLSPFQSFSILQNIVADINKGIEAAANTEKKAEKVGYGYSKRV
ncbi:hypothetical protein HMPREF4655_21378 [Helicobacter pylori 35A]|uniref:DUF874 family protein n=1 Tax=Helicobacter pylori TaxID=210 RepID=UPI0001DA0667|nr:DUF874 family protein [Helicobacter pylori]ADU41458.1 hypothetical protein HMPREF4655_21378 [Helicobacter pylori 35A]